MKKQVVFLSLTLLMLFISCSKTDLPNSESEQISIPSVSIKPAVPSEGGDIRISFTTTEAWTASVILTKSESWVDVNPKSGSSGNAEITITTAANQTGTERQATIQIKSGSDTKEIVLTQATMTFDMPVDLGLSVKWASCNLGASRPEEFGDYYAWGEIEPYYEGTGGWPKTPIWKEGKTSGYTLLSYCGSSEFVEWIPTPYYAATNVLLPAYDAAKVGDPSWRIPTKDDFVALAAGCVWVWTDNYNNTGVKGFIVYKAKNDDDKGKANINGTWKKWEASQYITEGVSEATGYTTVDTHIFLPAAGVGFKTNRVCDGDLDYWSSTVFYGGSEFAYSMYFYENVGVINPKGITTRDSGMSIRPVFIK